MSDGKKTVWHVVAEALCPQPRIADIGDGRLCVIYADGYPLGADVARWSLADRAWVDSCGDRLYPRDVIAWLPLPLPGGPDDE